MKKAWLIINLSLLLIAGCQFHFKGTDVEADGGIVRNGSDPNSSKFEKGV